MAKQQCMTQDLNVGVDEFYFLAVLEEENSDRDIFPVADDKYAEELQLQEVLIDCIFISQMKVSYSIASSSSSVMVMIEPEDTDRHDVSMEIIGAEKGQPSQSFCEICVEEREIHQMFKTGRCCHSFCSDCIAKHVLTKIQEPSNYYESIQMVRCPGENCEAVLQLETCRKMLPKGVIDEWERALCEAMINEAQKFYCPYKDCSVMLVNESEEDNIKESECPLCHRLFCAKCYVPWHSGVDCEEFQALNEDDRDRDDLMVIELARDQKWSRCPHCRFFVERTQGCPHMICRCKFQFCYGCGSEWTDDHGGCSRE